MTEKKVFSNIINGEERPAVAGAPRFCAADVFVNGVAREEDEKREQHVGATVGVAVAASGSGPEELAGHARVRARSTKLLTT